MTKTQMKHKAQDAIHHFASNAFYEDADALGMTEAQRNEYVVILTKELARVAKLFGASYENLA